MAQDQRADHGGYASCFLPQGVAQTPNHIHDHLPGVARTFDVIVTEDEDGWFVARVPALRGCLTQGRSHAEALENIREAIALFLESGEAPDPHVRSVALDSVTVEA
jgi:predicted RNase H-like HicB family nuclease